MNLLYILLSPDKKNWSKQPIHSLLLSIKRLALSPIANAVNSSDGGFRDPAVQLRNDFPAFASDNTHYVEFQCWFPQNETVWFLCLWIYGLSHGTPTPHLSLRIWGPSVGEWESQRRRDERHTGENKYHSVSPSFTHSLSPEVGVEVWRALQHPPTQPCEEDSCGNF